MAGSPRIIARPTTRSPAACRRARVRQGQAFGGAEEAPSLTAAAPRRRWKYAVGTEECSRRGSNKRMECKGRPKWRDAPLTKKAPYKPDAGNLPVRFIFVIAFGLGPMAGVLAIMIHSVGALGKLYSEIVENIDMKPVEGVRSTGASWLSCMRFAVLPQVAAGFAGYTLLRFEINVRGASVMGFVGGGGIGQELVVAIRKFYYSDVSAILLMIVLTVFVIDIGTGWIRGRLFGKDRHA